MLSQPVEIAIVQAIDGARLANSGDGDLTWNRSDDDTLSIELHNQRDERRAINVSATFILRSGAWQALFAGMNDHPEWPDNGVLRYVYIRSQDTMKMDGWNAWSMLTIPFGCLYDPAADVGIAFIGDDLEDALNTINFELQRTADGGAKMKITRPHVRLEPNGSAKVTMFAMEHAGDWRAGLGRMVDRWRDAFDVPDWCAKMQSTRYEGTSGSGGAEPGDYLTDEYWTQRFKGWPWHATGMIQSRGFDPWYGKWVPQKQPWRANIGHKIRHMIARPGAFPKEIIDARPPIDAPWREQVEFIENLDYQMPPAERRHANQNISSLYGLWEWLTHDDIHRLLDKIHSMGWYAISHFDIDEAFAPWLAQEFPESTYPGTVFYAEPIWKVPDGYPGSRWRKHIVDQVRKLYEVWPGYDGLMIDQLYYEYERDTTDDGITVTADGKPASNMHRNHGRIMKKIHEISRPLKKVVWGNHARTSFCITRWCDTLVSEGTAVRGMGEDPGKYMTLGTRGAHGLAHGELTMQNTMLRGWTISLWNGKKKSLDETDHDSHAYHIFPYFSLLELLPGRRWELSAHAYDPPQGYVGNLFRRSDGNVLATVVSYGVSMLDNWWNADVPVTVRLDDAAEFKAAYLLSADHLGPKKLPFERDGHEITVTIPLHRSVSMIVFAKTGRFAALDELILNGDTVTMWHDDWTSGTSQSQELKVDGTKRVGEVVRIKTTYDATRLLPKADALPGDVSTFEMLVGDPMIVSIAPPSALIERCQSNSSEFKQAWTSIKWAHPLSIDVGEERVFHATIVNASAKPVTTALQWTGRGVVLGDLPKSIDVPARGRITIPITARGVKAGAGGIDLNAASLDVRVVTIAVADADLYRLMLV